MDFMVGGRIKAIDKDHWPHDSGISKRYFSALSPALNNVLYIKRSLQPDEYPHVFPREYYASLRTRQALRNEAATIEFIRRNTTVPVPNIVAAFNDRGEEYILMEKVQGVVQMGEIEPERRAPIIRELEGYIAQIHQFKSKVFGGISGEIVPPPRMWVDRPVGMNMLEHPREPDADANSAVEYTLCHGDLNTMNVLVDPATLKIKCIIDWEYAGFYPPEFEGYWWKRRGPAQVAAGEEHMEDTRALTQRVIDLATPESKARAAPFLERDAIDVMREAKLAEEEKLVPEDKGL
jgi:aminoglycoside phosphotransferase